jgi:hypothetical protein
MYENAKTDTNCSAKQCLKQSRAIKAGERIYHAVKSGRDYHEKCASLQFSNKNASPKSPSGSPQGGLGKGKEYSSTIASPPVPSSISVEEIAEKRLIKAKQIVRRVNNLPSDAEDYSLSDEITEAFRQLGSEALSRKIQKNKIENMTKFRVM